MNIQNIYDNPEFFTGYKELRDHDQGFNLLLEQPAIDALLPDLKGTRIVDLGCGFGNFCRDARERGAASVLGIDPSHQMLEIAQTKTQDSAIRYQCYAMEVFHGPDAPVDLVISSLALHYVEDYGAMVKKIYQWLKIGGYFIFSVEHPLCTANPNFQTDATGLFWPLYNYRDEKVFHQNWFVENVVKYHRTIATYLNTLMEHGFTLKRMLEPMATDDMIKRDPQMIQHKLRPPLLAVSAQKL